MANFYNPYMKGPDFAGGISDMVGKLLQMMMMKQVFGGMGGAEGQGGGPLGQAGGQVGSPQMNAQAQGGGPPPGQGQAQMGGPQMNAQAQGGGAMPMLDPNKELKISPQILQALMMMLKNPSGGGMGQMGQRGY